jgi:energy-coupling factor transport system permease protein
VRGYGSARRGGGGFGGPWSRHDRAFLASAIAIAALTVASRVVPLAGYETYPELHGAPAGEAIMVALAYALVALLPFADRRGIAP